MANHASEYADEDDSPVVGLLNVLRAYGADTSEARLRSDSSETCGEVPLPGRGGRLPHKLERLAHELGWATERHDDHLRVAHGEDVDPARDSLLPLTRRTSTDLQKRTLGVDGWTQDGARTLVNDREGVLTSCEALAQGDEVYVQYRDTRTGGGYAYSNARQEFTATVLHTDDEQVVLTASGDSGVEDSGRFDLTCEYEGEAVWETPEGDTKAVKHLVRLD